MKNLLELRNTTKALLRGRKPDRTVLEEALPLCLQLWDVLDQTNELWDAWQYAKCLFDLERFLEAEEICKQVYNKYKDIVLEAQQEYAFNYTINLYARIINDGYFRTIKKELTNDEINFLLDKAILLGSLVKHEKNSPLEFCAFRAIQIAKKNLPIFPSEKVLEIMKPLNAANLSQDTYKSQLENGKTIEIQSRQEAYYSYKTKALLALKRYEECLDCCHEALEVVSQFHFGNEIWIEDRLLNCIANLGNVDDAITRAEKLIMQKESWFLLYELAKLYLQAGRKTEAELFMYRAAYTRDPLEMKVKLLETIGDLLAEAGDEVFAQKNYLLIKQVREKNKWKIGFSLQNKIRSDEVVDEREIKREWLNRIYNLLETKEGTVSKISSSGKTGFIKYTEGSVFFFVKNFIGRSDKLKENDKVKFVIIKSFDHKKQQESLEANYITPIRS